jgi:hypothetical protein
MNLSGKYLLWVFVAEEPSKLDSAAYTATPTAILENEAGLKLLQENISVAMIQQAYLVFTLQRHQQPKTK